MWFLFMKYQILEIISLSFFSVCIDSFRYFTICSFRFLYLFIQIPTKFLGMKSLPQWQPFNFCFHSFSDFINISFSSTNLRVRCFPFYRDKCALSADSFFSPIIVLFRYSWINSDRGLFYRKHLSYHMEY